MSSYRIGPVQKKIMLTVLGGVALGLSNSPSQYFHTFSKIQKDWREIDGSNFKRSIKRLSQNKLIEEKKMRDGSFKLFLTKNGRREVSRFILFENTIDFKKPKKWDKRWRIVTFDIPEVDRVFRDILRRHLSTLEFYKLQQSVFVSPHPFEKQIISLAKIYSATPYVRVITAVSIDNESRLKKHFFKAV